MKKTEVQGVWEIFPRSQITKQILTKAAWLQFIPIITTSQYGMYDIYDINHKNELQGKKKNEFSLLYLPITETWKCHLAYMNFFFYLPYNIGQHNL